MTNNHKLLAAEHGLLIDPDFRVLCPTQSADESAQLERSLLAEGCRDDLVAWKATKEILDGHNRHPLCERHGIPFGVVFLDLPDREACSRWMLANQLARRNISSQAASYLRGTRYLMEKQAHGGNHVGGNHVGGNHVGGNHANGNHADTVAEVVRLSTEDANGNHANGNDADGGASYHSDNLPTAARLADEYRVGQATILRDGTFAAAVDAIAESCGHEAKQVILARDSVITRRAVLLLAKMNAETRQQAIEELIENGKLPRRTRGKKATITLPADPQALAEKLFERLGPEACFQIVAKLKKLLPRGRSSEFIPRPGGRQTPTRSASKEQEVAKNGHAHVAEEPVTKYQ